jgi:Tol biopolymer transport system component
VFGRQGKLWAIGFDANALQTRGAAHPVRDDVLWSPAGYPQFTVDGGLLAYVRTSQAAANLGTSVLALVDRQGRKRVLPIQPTNFLLPRWSPTGDRLVVQVGASKDLWTYELSRGTFTRLTSDRIIAYAAPAWSPDGRRVIFVTWFDRDVGLGSLQVDGSGPVDVLIKGIGMRSFERTNPAMLPDGSGMILSGLAPGTSTDDLLFVGLAGEKRLELLFHAAGVERNPSIAPNGRFIAYDSDESGHTEVFVRPFPNVGSRKWQVSTEGGAGPVWTRAGREIVYMDNRGRMMAVAIARNNNDEFDSSKPVPLFNAIGKAGINIDRDWDVTADGERFLFNVNDAPATESASDLTLIQNWDDELKRLVPREHQ